MKKKLILGSFLALYGITHSQNTAWPGSTSSSPVGIGTTAPIDKLEVKSINNDGITITQTTYGAANLSLNNTQSGSHKYILGSTGPASAEGNGNFYIYDYTNAVAGGPGNRFFINGSTGNIGIGTTSPSEKLNIVSGVSDDGLRLVQQTNGGCIMHMENQSYGGHDWGIGSFGTSSPQGSGNLVIRDYTSGVDRFLIEGSTGNMGIGTAAPTSKLEIRQNANTQTQNRGFYSDATNTSWTAGTQGANTGVTIGVQGRSGAPAFGQQFSNNYGVYGEAYGGESYGGCFIATSNSAPATGVFGSASSPGVSVFAGYFNGNVYGTSFGPSDRKLKNNIKPLNKALDKLKLLKPSVYTYKTEEFKDMNLPKGEQMGLIAQELEEVFPELILEVKNKTQKNEKGEVILNIVDHKSVNYTSLIPLLIAGVQEQQATIESQQKQLDEQKELINSLTQKGSNITGINNIATVETGFQMSQNEPNPFTHETVVKYTLPQTIGNAFMAVYDLTGKQITTFPINEKGSSSITITSEKLAAGIYIYSIVADGKVIDSKRMIVADK